MQSRKHNLITAVGLSCVTGLALCSTPAHPSDDLVGFQISIGVEFETEEVAIPGWEGGQIFEPKGYGLITIHAGFPSDGGAAEVASATVTLKRYGGVGPNCTLRVPDDAVNRTFAPVVFKRLFWNKQLHTMHISADIDYPDYEMTVRVTCPPIGEVPIPDRPLFKIFGPFTQNRDTKFQGIAIQLTDQPVTSRTIKDVLFGEPMVYRATLDVVVEKKAPAR